LKPEKDETRQAVISFVLTHPNSYVSPYFLFLCKKVTAIDGIVQWNNSIDLDPDLVYLKSDTVVLK